MASRPQQDAQPNTTSADADADTGFAAAFAERSSDPYGQEGEAKDDAGASSDKEPADKAGSELAPADVAATEAPANGAAEQADPWNGLTPEQKAHVERLMASERSQRGRVGALQKKLNAREAAAKAAGETGQPAEDKSATELDTRLAKANEEYGDVVGPLVEALAEVRGKIDKITNGPAEQLEIDADAEAIAVAHDELKKVHPDFQTVAADANFNSWLGDQPEKVIALANSYDPREVSLVLTLFKTERSTAQALSGQQGEQGKTDTATDDKRKRQLEGSRQVPGKGQPAAAGTPNDFGSAFKARANQQR